MASSSTSPHSSSPATLMDIATEIQAQIFDEVAKSNDNIYTVGIARLINGRNADYPPPDPELDIPQGYVPVIKKGYHPAILSAAATPIVFANENEIDEIHAETSSQGTSRQNHLNLQLLCKRAYDVVRDLCKPVQKPSATVFMQYSFGPRILEALAPHLMDHVQTVVLTGTHDHHAAPAGRADALWPNRPEFVEAGTLELLRADLDFRRFARRCFGQSARWPHVRKLVCRNYYPWAFPEAPPPEGILAGAVIGRAGGFELDFEDWIGLAGTCAQATLTRREPGMPFRGRWRCHVSLSGCACTASLMRVPGAFLVDCRWPRFEEFPCQLQWS